MRVKRMSAALGAAAVLGGTLVLINAASAQNQGETRVRVETQQGETRVQADPSQQSRQNEREQGFYRASEVLGTTVKGEGGESLGTIQDLLIDQKTQQIQYFILSDSEAPPARPGVRVEQREAQQSNLTVVPWSVARPQWGTTSDSRFVSVPLAPQRLQQAPTFTWQEIQTGPPRWVNDVNRFYGVRGGVTAPGFRGEIDVERDGDIEIDRERIRDRD